MSLINDVDDFDSKHKILNSLIVISERMEGQIAPYVTTILQVLTDLWESSEGQHLVRTSIVTILTKLIIALRAESYRLNHIVLPILKQSLDTSDPGHLYLMEEGLELWLAVLMNAQSCSPEFLQLIPTAISLLSYGSENLKRIIHIM